MLLPFNNRMRKKGVEHTSNNSSSTHKDQHGRMRTKKYVVCSQTIISKKSKPQKGKYIGKLNHLIKKTCRCKSKATFKKVSRFKKTIID